MSGGSFDYGYWKVAQLAEEIERMFVNDGYYQTEDYSVNDFFGARSMKQADHLCDANPEQRTLILADVKQLIKDLRNVAARAKELEWLTSGDTGADTYLKRLEEIKKELV